MHLLESEVVWGGGGGKRFLLGEFYNCAIFFFFCLNYICIDLNVTARETGGEGERRAERFQIYRFQTLIMIFLRLLSFPFPVDARILE